MPLSFSTCVASKFALIVAASLTGSVPAPLVSVAVSLPMSSVSRCPFAISVLISLKMVDTLTVLTSDCGRKMSTITRITASVIRSQKRLVLSHFPLVDIMAPLLFQYPQADRERTRTPAASSEESIPTKTYSVKWKCTRIHPDNTFPVAATVHKCVVGMIIAYLIIAHLFDFLLLAQRSSEQKNRNRHLNIRQNSLEVSHL